MMKHLIVWAATLAIMVAFGMLYMKGDDKEKPEPILKTIAIVGIVAFLILAFVLPGESSDD